jgi:hypothetical protein
MNDQPETIREAVGVFANENDLQAAIDELLSSGFHRAELSLLASEEALNAKLASGFANIYALPKTIPLFREPHMSRLRLSAMLKVA